jgi:transposase
MRGFKKNGKQSIGKTRGGWNTKLHLVSANDKIAFGLSLSGGNEGDAPEGRKLLNKIGKTSEKINLLMDRAYEGDETRNTAKELNYIPVVPPKSNRKEPWQYNKELYKNRNVIERFFRRLKEFRRIFTRYDKLDSIFIGFLYFGLIVIMIK